MHTVSGPTEICLSWHAGFRHWWITHCLNAGTNGGFSWLEEDVRYLGGGGRGRVKRIRLEKGVSLGNTCSRLLLKGLFAKIKGEYFKSTFITSRYKYTKYTLNI